MLRVGSVGDAVRKMQELLLRHGATIEADGSFGQLIRGPPWSFQRRTGLDVDGIAGPKTWGVLEAR